MSRNGTLESIRNSCGLVDLDVEGDELLLHGTRGSCKQALLFLKAHLAYAEVLQAGAGWVGARVVGEPRPRVPLRARFLVHLQGNNPAQSGETLVANTQHA